MRVPVHQTPEDVHQTPEDGQRIPEDVHVAYALLALKDSKLQQPFGFD